MANAKRRMDPERQAALDMAHLVNLPQFLRFLFRIASKSGIAAVSTGSEGATSYHDGRRSLGLELLSEADAVLAVRDPAMSPFTILAMATNEQHKLLSQEAMEDDGLSESDEYDRR